MSEMVGALADGHHYDECRFVDGETGQWGYVIECFAEDHKELICEREGEMFRLRPSFCPNCKKKIINRFDELCFVCEICNHKWEAKPW